LACALAACGGLSACLDDGSQTIEGRRIVPGRDPARPALVRAGAELLVVYETLKPSTDPSPWAPRLWSVPYAGGEPRRLAENGAWPITIEQGGTALILQDLQLRAGDPLGRWFPQIPATLTRVELISGREVRRFQPMLDFGFWDGQLYVETTTPGLPLRQIVVERPDGSEQAMTPAADIRWSPRGEAFLLIPAASVADTTLVRVRRPGSPPEVLHRGVTHFMIHPSGDLVLAWAVEPGGTEERAWLLDLGASRAGSLGLSRTCSWLDFVPRSRQLICVQPTAPAAGGGASELHVLDLDAGQDRTVPISSEDPRHLTFQWAPGGNRVALLHDRSRVWLFRPEAERALEPLGRRVFRADFSPDGRFVVFIDVGPGPDGVTAERLSVYDTATGVGPRVMTPDHRVVQSYAFTDDGASVLYVSHAGDYKADLHVADLVGGGHRLLAERIGWWIWPWASGSVVVEPQLQAQGQRILVVAGWSSQDRVGDLLLIDLRAGTEEVLARSVFDFTVAPRCAGCRLLEPGANVALVLQERVPSERDGLWAVTLP
jgi:hypothetical protein